MWFAFVLWVGLMASSCKDELVFPEPTREEAMQVSSNVANLMMRIAMKDGSFDDILDGASCISIKLPVTVDVHGQEITIKKEAEFELLRELLSEYGDDLYRPGIVFPIHIVFPDHTSVRVSSREELEKFASECMDAGSDADIECLDFVFPLNMTELDLISERLEPYSV